MKILTYGLKWFKRVELLLPVSELFALTNLYNSPL